MRGVHSTSTWLRASLVIALAGCTARSPRPAPESHPPGTVAPPVVPVTAREIRAMTRSGAHAMLVNVWATWCAPCREEFPTLLRAAHARERDGLRLVLVSADFADQLPAVRRFLAAQGVTDTTYLKTGDDMAFIDSLDPRWSGALPATFVYDGAGRLTAFWEGRAEEARLTQSLDQALTRHPPREDP